jgi:hypothetical protein
MERAFRTARSTVQTVQHKSATKAQILKTLGCSERELTDAVAIADERKGIAAINAATRLTENASDYVGRGPAILVSEDSYARIQQRKREHAAHGFRVEVERLVQGNHGRFIDGPAILLPKNAK